MVGLFGRGLDASSKLEKLPPDYGLREHLSSYNKCDTGRSELAGSFCSLFS